MTFLQTSVTYTRIPLISALYACLTHLFIIHPFSNYSFLMFSGSREKECIRNKWVKFEVWFHTLYYTHTVQKKKKNLTEKANVISEKSIFLWLQNVGVNFITLKTWITLDWTLYNPRNKGRNFEKSWFIPKFLSWSFGHLERTAWLER